MENDVQKKELLNYLVQNAEDNPEILVALETEAKNIQDILQHEQSYNILEQQLDLLDIICYRVSEQTISLLKQFLKRLEVFTPIFEDEYFFKYKTSEKLVIKTLKIIINLRYYEDVYENVIDILLEYSVHKDEAIRKQAEEGIDLTTRYNLDVYEKIRSIPQQGFIKKIKNLSNEEYKKYFEAIVKACKNILATEINGTRSDYQTVTFHRASLPFGNNKIQELRSECKVILKSLYKLAEEYSQKKNVINALEKITGSPSHPSLNEQELGFHKQDVFFVLDCFKEIIKIEQDMLILQDIEHTTYWISYRRPKDDTDILNKALEIRDFLYTHEEYKVFRILVGFEAVFRDWKNWDSFDSDKEQEVRTKAMDELIKSVNESNFEIWKSRITSYAKIKSNDLAMFPCFGKFIRALSEVQPKFCLMFLEKNADEIEQFMPAFLHGLLASSEKDKVISIITEWSQEGRFLPHILQFMQHSLEIYIDILTIILEKAKKTLYASEKQVFLSYIINIATAHYKEHDTILINEFFIPAIEILSKEEISWGWVNNFWYQKNISKVLSDMDNNHLKIIIHNLIKAPEVDYHIEEILLPIAEKSPELVLDFFCKRIEYEKEYSQKEGDYKSYEDIPFGEFHKLSEPLSKNVSLVLEKILPTFDSDNSWRFEYAGASLIHHIFPNFSDDLERELIKCIQLNQYCLLAIIYVLKTYKGQSFIHEVCKELIKVIPSESDDLISSLQIALTAEGVVSGEYGFADSYQAKADSLRPWLDDTDSKVRAFAKEFIDATEKMAERERKSAEEGIILRKHRFGSSITDGE